MLTIAGLTFKEALRKKILVAAVILTLLFLILYGTGLYFVEREITEAMKQSIVEQKRAAAGEFAAQSAQMMFEQARRMFAVLGIYFSSLIVSVLAVFSSVGSVASEVENGMLHAVLAKPIRRRAVILGKFLGYALMLVSYSLLLFASILGLNYFIFGTAIPNVASALALFVLQPLVLLAITMAGSTRLSTLTNGVAAFMVYMIGVIGGMVEQIGAMIENSSMQTTGIIASLIMPVDAIYRKIVVTIFGSTSNPLEAFSFGPFGAISEPSTAMIIYAFLYILSFVLIAIGIFTRRDLG